MSRVSAPRLSCERAATRVSERAKRVMGDCSRKSSLAISSSRLTDSVSSTRPRELENPRLVVANASNPSDAKSFAVPASQGFGSDPTGCPYAALNLFTLVGL